MSRRPTNLSPYGIAAHAAECARRTAQVHPLNRHAYFRRVAFRALRRAEPHIAALWAWDIAKSASTACLNGNTINYFAN